jgi:hypothetical protein
MWLWAADPGADMDEAAVRTLWQARLRRFGLEHAFQFLKSRLGWDKALLRDPAAAGRWTWLLIICFAQLYLARTLAADIRLPWQRPQARPREPGSCPPAGSAPDSGTSAEHSARPPAPRKPARPAPDGRQARRTSTRHPATPRPARKNAG